MSTLTILRTDAVFAKLPMHISSVAYGTLQLLAYRRQTGKAAAQQAESRPLAPRQPLGTYETWTAVCRPISGSAMSSAKSRRSGYRSWRCVI